MAASTPLPRVVLKEGAERRLRRGHPWAFSNEIHAAPEALAPGAPVTVASASGKGQGSFFWHPHSLIAARRYSHENDAAPDADFWKRRLERALALRERFYDAPFYRLCHGEADGLPGAALDRFGGHFVLRTESAGVERCKPALLEALQALFAPESVVFRDDSRLRALEGLALGVSAAHGRAPERAEVPEGKVVFRADLLGRQKTGWFYDQRPQRLNLAELAGGARVLDLYCGTGGFALQAAAGGAASVLGIDSRRSSTRSCPRDGDSEQA